MRALKGWAYILSDNEFPTGFLNFKIQLKAYQIHSFALINEQNYNLVQNTLVRAETNKFILAVFLSYFSTYRS